MKLTPLLAAATFVVASPAIALAQTSAPVALISSSAQPQIADVVRPELGSAKVSFVNHGTVAATQVDFILSSNGEPLQTLTERGTFSPGVTISHEFATDRTERDLQVSIADVKFADGTEWVNDAPLPQGQRAVHDWMSNPDAN